MAQPDSRHPVKGTTTITTWSLGGALQHSLLYSRPQGPTMYPQI